MYEVDCYLTWNPSLIRFCLDSFKKPRWSLNYEGDFRSFNLWLFLSFQPLTRLSRSTLQSEETWLLVLFGFVCLNSFSLLTKMVNQHPSKDLNIACLWIYNTSYCCGGGGLVLVPWPILYLRGQCFSQGLLPYPVILMYGTATRQQGFVLSIRLPQDGLLILILAKAKEHHLSHAIP